MPRPARPWFRFYSEALTNAKVFALGTARPELFFQWVMLLNLANISTKRGYLPADIADIAFALRESPQKTAEILSELQHMNFIDLKGQRLYMHHWHQWNPDSDANLTPARAKRAHGTLKEQGRNAEYTRKERLDREGDKERDKEGDTEGEEDTRAPVVEPADGLFVREYVRHYQQSHAGAPPSPIERGAALALETDYGSEKCMRAAEETGWAKHPNWLRRKLEDPDNGRAKAPVFASRGGARSVITNADLDDLERYKRGEID